MEEELLDFSARGQRDVRVKAIKGHRGSILNRPDKHGDCIEFHVIYQDDGFTDLDSLERDLTS
jgi:hypothetical protein